MSHLDPKHELNRVAVTAVIANIDQSKWTPYRNVVLLMKEDDYHPSLIVGTRLSGGSRLSRWLLSRWLLVHGLLGRARGIIGR